MDDFNEQFRKQFQQQLEGNQDTEPKSDEPQKPQPQKVTPPLHQEKKVVPNDTRVEEEEKNEIKRKRIRDKYFSGLFHHKSKEKIVNKKHGTLLKIIIGVTNILIIIGVVVLIRTFIVSPFSVVGNSMSSNLRDGDLILVDKMKYRFSKPSRGDIIVFHPPIEKYSEISNPLYCTLKKIGYTLLLKDSSDACKVRDYFVKRIIGIPGDTVKIKNKKVYVAPPDGQLTEVREDFLDTKNQNNTCFSSSCNSSRDTNGIFLEVPENTLFVLGDNRTGSSDSRAWKVDGKDAPFVNMDDVAGRVKGIFFPFSDISFVSSLDILSSPENKN